LNKSDLLNKRFESLLQAAETYTTYKHDNTNKHCKNICLDF